MSLSSEIEVKKQRLMEIEPMLSNPEIIGNPRKFASLTTEYNGLRELIETFDALSGVQKDIEGAREMIGTNDPEMRALAEEELQALQKKEKALEESLEETLHPPDPLDGKSTIMEIRAGAGGDEAALFASELFRMYAQYANAQKWKTTQLSQNANDLGGAKEIVFEIIGKNVYSKLKWESGVHRVQRVPETEKAGRIHTSTVTVAVLPKLEDFDFELDPKELKIETSTARGHGGQSVNTTYSAIRMTHIPTGITVSCQDERSQVQNRERAMEIMRSRVFDFYEEKRKREHAEARKAQIGSGDRSEKIRTYNFPQDRITDHRIKESWHNVQQVLDGDLDRVIEKLKDAEKILLRGGTLAQVAGSDADDEE